MASETRLAIGQARMRRRSPRMAASLECGRWPVNWKDCRPVPLQLSARNRPRMRPWRRRASDKTVAGLKKNRVCCPTDRREPSSPMPAEPVTIKKYANRRLYNTGTSTYVTLEDLAAMVKAGEDFTRQVLAQIIFEQENKEGQSLLPIAFLRQLIRFYGDSMQMLVPRYLEVSIDSFTREQEKFRQQIAQASLRGSEPPINTPRFQSIRIACPPPHGETASSTSWPRARSPSMLAAGSPCSTTLLSPTKKARGPSIAACTSMP